MSHRASEELLLGIDIGTSAVKGIICDVSGQTVAPASREHEVRTPHPGWAEEPPTDWWHNVGV
jgi:xylulokinase